jgi:DNA-binding IclR family transcriptional regulator
MGNVDVNHSFDKIGVDMQTVDKAMKILSQFSTQRPEIGLSELARMTGIDKAGSRRLLVALQKHAFIEQNLDTRDYRLGVGFLHLARVRESTFPMANVIEPVLHNLTKITEETVHASLSAGMETNLMTIGVSPSTRATRVHLQDDEPLPIHATASGLAFLAFSTPERFQTLIKADLMSYTASTVSDVEQLREAVATSYKNGYAVSNQTYEEEAFGIAAPFFDAMGQPSGAIAIASPTSRMSKEREVQLAILVVNAAIEITKAIGGTVNEEFLAINEKRIK